MRTVPPGFINYRDRKKDPTKWQMPSAVTEKTVGTIYDIFNKNNAVGTWAAPSEAFSISVNGKENTNQYLYGYASKYGTCNAAVTSFFSGIVDGIGNWLGEIPFLGKFFHVVWDITMYYILQNVYSALFFVFTGGQIYFWGVGEHWFPPAQAEREFSTMSQYSLSLLIASGNFTKSLAITDTISPIVMDFVKKQGEMSSDNLSPLNYQLIECRIAKGIAQQQHQGYFYNLHDILSIAFDNDYVAYRKFLIEVVENADNENFFTDPDNLAKFISVTALNKMKSGTEVRSSNNIIEIKRKRQRYDWSNATFKCDSGNYHTKPSNENTLTVKHSIVGSTLFYEYYVYADLLKDSPDVDYKHPRINHGYELIVNKATTFPINNVKYLYKMDYIPDGDSIKIFADENRETFFPHVNKIAVPGPGNAQFIQVGWQIWDAKNANTTQNISNNLYENADTLDFGSATSEDKMSYIGTGKYYSPSISAEARFLVNGSRLPTMDDFEYIKNVSSFCLDMCTDYDKETMLRVSAFPLHWGADTKQAQGLNLMNLSLFPTGFHNGTEVVQTGQAFYLLQDNKVCNITNLFTNEEQNINFENYPNIKFTARRIYDLSSYDGTQFTSELSGPLKIVRIGLQNWYIDHFKRRINTNSINRDAAAINGRTVPNKLDYINLFEYLKHRIITHPAAGSTIRAQFKTLTGIQLNNDLEYFTTDTIVNNSIQVCFLTQNDNYFFVYMPINNPNGNILRPLMLTETNVDPSMIFA